MDNPLELGFDSKQRWLHSDLVAEPLAVRGLRFGFKSGCSCVCRWFIWPLLLATVHAGLFVYFLEQAFMPDATNYTMATTYMATPTTANEPNGDDVISDDGDETNATGISWLDLSQQGLVLYDEATGMRSSLQGLSGLSVDPVSQVSLLPKPFPADDSGLGSSTVEGLQASPEPSVTPTLKPDTPSHLGLGHQPLGDPGLAVASVPQMPIPEPTLSFGLGPTVPSGLENVASQSTALPSVASQSAALPSVASQSTALPGVASQSTALPGVASQSTALPGVASQSTALPGVASQSTALPNVASQSTAPVSVASQVIVSPNHQSRASDEPEVQRAESFMVTAPPPNIVRNTTELLRRRVLSIKARMHRHAGFPLRNDTRMARRLKGLQPQSVRPLASWVLSWVEVGSLSFGALYVIVCFCCMFSPPPRRGQHVHTGDAGPPFLGTATLKCPPTWCVEKAHSYTLRSWISDLVLWSTATEVPVDRQAAIAALQITGSARELVREIPPEQLRDGAQDPQTGQMLTGLMVLVQHLARRYAPMEQETSTKAISELLNFVRIPGETIDELLVRFDILRNRAAVRGGLGVNIQGLSWMLLRALQLGPDDWDKFLQFNAGQLPHDQDTMNQLVERIRRYGHLHEGAMKHGTRQGGTGDPGNYFFPTFNSSPGMASANMHPTPSAGGGFVGASFAGNAQNQGLSQMFTGSAGLGPTAEAYVSQEDGAAQCPHCLSFFDEEFSSGTDSDSETEDSEAAGLYQSVMVDGVARQDEEAILGQVYQDYVMAKRRWRRMSGRPPRRYRKFNYKQKRHVPHLQRSAFRGTYASFLPPGAFAAGKGQGKGGKKGGSGWNKNPRGRDGKPLRCLRCGSDEHLFKRCPQVVSNQSHRSDHHAFSAPVIPALPSPPAVSTFMVEPWRSTGVFHAADSVKHYHLSSVPSGPGSAAPSQASVAAGYMAMSEPSHWQGLKGFEVEIDRLRSVSQPASEAGSSGHASRSPQAHTVNAEVPPSWEPGTSSSAVPVAPFREGETVAQVPVQRLLCAASQPAYPPPQQPAPTNMSEVGNKRKKEEEAASRRQVVKDLSSMLYPWWEVVDVPAGSTSDAAVFHLRTRLAGDRVGLLVDPGAHDNLAGENTMRRLSEQVSKSPVVSGLTKQLTVEGVGKDAQQAHQAWEVPIFMRTEDGNSVTGKYRAPVIPGSTLPPLLGLKALRAMGAVIDCAQGKLLMPGPGGYTFQLSPGSRMFRLALSDSGHLILPVDCLEPQEPEGQ